MNRKILDTIMVWTFVGIVILSVFVSLKLVGEVIDNLKGQ